MFFTLLHATVHKQYFDIAKTYVFHCLLLEILYLYCDGHGFYICMDMSTVLSACFCLDHCPACHGIDGVGGGGVGLDRSLTNVQTKTSGI
jgi:hypothetical protein